MLYVAPHQLLGREVREALNQAFEPSDEQVGVWFKRLEVLKVARCLRYVVIKLGLITIGGKDYRQTHRRLLVVNQVENGRIFNVLKVFKVTLSLHRDDVIVLTAFSGFGIIRSGHTLVWNTGTDCIFSVRNWPTLRRMTVCHLVELLLLSLKLDNLILLAKLVHRFDRIRRLKKALPLQDFSVCRVILKAHDVLNLVYVDEVDLTQSFLPYLSTQAQLTLVQ